MPKTELLQAVETIEKAKLDHLPLSDIKSYANMGQKVEDLSAEVAISARVESAGLNLQMLGMRKPNLIWREIVRFGGIGVLSLSLILAAGKGQETAENALAIPGRVAGIAGAQVDLTRIDFTKIDFKNLLNGHPDQIFAPALERYNANIDNEKSRLGTQVQKTANTFGEGVKFALYALIYSWFRPWRGASRISTAVCPWAGKTLEQAGKVGRLLQKIRS